MRRTNVSLLWLQNTKARYERRINKQILLSSLYISTSMCFSNSTLNLRFRRVHSLNKIDPVRHKTDKKSTQDEAKLPSICSKLHYLSVARIRYTTPLWQLWGKSKIFYIIKRVHARPNTNQGVSKRCARCTQSQSNTCPSIWATRYNRLRRARLGSSRTNSRQFAPSGHELQWAGSHLLQGSFVGANALNERNRKRIQLVRLMSFVHDR